jgi:mannose-6-phosphate isomerase-like protein (cupin superfamily)
MTTLQNPDPVSAPHETFADFEARQRAAGFDTVLERRWAPDTVIETHTHDFSVDALVVQGELWLGCHGEVRHLQPGDRFTLDANVPHDERYGAEGATFWVARRSA